MNDLILKGMTSVSGMKFHDIEGGFGLGKKSLLAKDIAVIHGKDLRHINEAINSNRKRFTDGVHIIDLLGVDLTDTEIIKFGFTQQAINSYRGLKAKGLQSGIYVLSERGYAVLLKILEDDVAWEQYDKLVDNYFNMRSTIKDTTQSNRLAVQEKNAHIRASQTYLRIAEHPSLPPEYKNILLSYATKELSGSEVFPLPDTGGRTYTATELGNEFGVSANRIGKIANANGLKTPEYGIEVWDKSRHSAKEVPSWRYNETGRQRLREILGA